MVRILSASAFIWAQETGTFVPVLTFSQLDSPATGHSCSCVSRSSQWAPSNCFSFLSYFLWLQSPQSSIPSPVSSHSTGAYSRTSGQLLVCDHRGCEIETLGFAEFTYAAVHSSYPCRLLAAAIAPIYAWLRLRSEKRSTELPPAMQTAVLLALLNRSMSFLLFTFHVHEKTILLSLFPLTLLLSTAPHDSSTFKLGVLANNVGSSGARLFSTPCSDHNDFVPCGPS